MKKFVLILLPFILLFNLLNAQNSWQETAILQSNEHKLLIFFKPIS